MSLKSRPFQKRLAITCAYTHTRAKVTLISILILKAIDSTQKSKRFSSQSSLEAFKGYISIQGTPIKKQAHVSSFDFKTSLLKERMKIFVALLTKEKILNGKMMTLDFFRALYNVYRNQDDCFFHTYLLTCLNKDISVLLKFMNI